MKEIYVRILGISALVVLVSMLGTAAYFGKNQRNGRKGRQAAETMSKQYVCSMHPQVIRDMPGDCPICGMFLVELVQDAGNRFDSSITDNARSVNETILGSVKNVTPVWDTLPVVIEAQGIINYDPRMVSTISARFGGYIEKTFVKYQFQHIRKGQKIFEIYSPDIYTERWNYVKLVQAYPDRNDLTREALEWFNLLGLSTGQVDSLKRTIKPDYYLPVYSYLEGYAVNKDFDPETFFINGADDRINPAESLAGIGNLGFIEGITVETGTPLFKLIDVTALRIDLKVKTEYAPLIKKGQKVIITCAAYPDRQFAGYISQIDPLNGGLFQTVRVYLRDDERILLPGRQIEARIITGSRGSLWVPATAVADLGQHRSVFVLITNKYVATEVRTGVRLNDKIEILYGIDKNSQIAEKAMLLVDSDGFIRAD